MSGRTDSLAGTRLPESVCARCAHAGGLLGWLEAVLPPLPFAMCSSPAEERPGRILALPNGFLKTLVAKRYGDELMRYAESVRLERVEIVVDPTVSILAADGQPPDEPRQARPTRAHVQPLRHHRPSARTHRCDLRSKAGAGPTGRARAR
jgi:hypothetical protein